MDIIEEKSDEEKSSKEGSHESEDEIHTQNQEEYGSLVCNVMNILPEKKESLDVRDYLEDKLIAGGSPQIPLEAKWSSSRLVK